MAIRDRLAHTFAVSLENATDEEYYKASALIVRELLAKGPLRVCAERGRKTGTKQIYYLCMEFLLGRSLRNNLCNLGLEENFRKALADYGIKLDNLYEQEPDAGPGQRRPGPPGRLLYGRPGHPGLPGHGLLPAVRVRPVPPEAGGRLADRAARHLAARRRHLAAAGARKLRGSPLWRPHRGAVAQPVPLRAAQGLHLHHRHPL